MKNKQIILALDSAESFLKLALYANGKIYKTQKKIIKQEQHLFVLINKLLNKAKIDFKDINELCVLKGPGRFTGIRIGLTLASIMKEFNKTQSFSVSLLEALCFETVNTQTFKKWFTKHPKAIVACVTHAFRQEYYLQFFKPGFKNVPVAKTKPIWISQDNLISNIKKQKSSLFVTGWAKDYASLTDIIKDKKHTYMPIPSSGLNPKTLIEMVKSSALVVRDLKPIYLKKARFES